MKVLGTEKHIFVKANGAFFVTHCEDAICIQQWQ